MPLKKVILTSDVYDICLQHALSTEKEEIMGVLIGQVDEENLVSYISACKILLRLDKQRDRVEISPEQLQIALLYAEELTQELNQPMRVVGWYHSHPHITVWPSHVDIRTQLMYQQMDPQFVGLIFSVFHNEAGSAGNSVQVVCFQGHNNSSDLQRKEVALQIQDCPLQFHNLRAITELSLILFQEESNAHKEEDDDINDPLTCLHNASLKTRALTHIVAKIATPLCLGLEARLKATKARIKYLEKFKKSLEVGDH